MRIDAHQHFWKYEPAQYPWIQPPADEVSRSKLPNPIRRDFLPRDLKPLLDKAGIGGCVTVQARQSLGESRWLLSLAVQHSFIRGVVGWVDLRSVIVTEQLGELVNDPRFVGVRHVVQDEPNDRFMLAAEFLRGIDVLREFDLAYDILIYARQLPAAIQLVKRFPLQRFIADHIAKPAIKRRAVSPWSEHIRQLAQFPNVFCKISGMVTEADWRGWRKEDFNEYLDVAFDAFGPARLMYGSDWPVCLLAADYRQVHDIVANYCSRLSISEQEQVFGGTARRAYRLQC
jgi:L-fuconolactonase